MSKYKNFDPGEKIVANFEDLDGNSWTCTTSRLGSSSDKEWGGNVVFSSKDMKDKKINATYYRSTYGMEGNEDLRNRFNGFVTERHENNGGCEC